MKECFADECIMCLEGFCILKDEDSKGCYVKSNDELDYVDEAWL